MMHEKFPLMSKSNRLQKQVSKANEENPDEIDLVQLPGGPKAFELCAKFCYGITVTLNPYNVVAAHCTAEYLEMTEDVDRGNLIFKIEAECSDEILFGQNSTQPLSLCSGRVFGQNSARPLSLYSGRVFGRDSSRPLSLCSGRVFRRDSARPLSLYSGRVFGKDSARAKCSPSTSQPSPSLPTKNALGDVKDQTKDEANPKPWYTANEKSSKMSTEDLVELLREYPFPVGWYARLPGLQEQANYDTKFETGVYEEQVKSGYRFPLHPFALRFFEHYRMAPRQLVPNGWRKLVGLIYLVQTSGYKPDATDFMRVQRLLKGGPKSNKGWHSRYFFVGRLDKGELPFDRDWNPFCKDFENPGKPTPNNQTKHILSHIKLRGGLCINESLPEEQLEWVKIIPPSPIPAGLLIPSLPHAIPSMTSAETVPLEMASGSGKSPQGGFLDVLQKAKGKRKEKQPSAELPPIPKRIRVTPPKRSPRILGQVSIDDYPIFRPRWTLRRDDLGMPDSQVSEQHLLHGILPRDKEVFQTQTHETLACSFAQAVYTMYASGSEMFSRFEMARQVAADEAQQKREAVKEAQEASLHVEELSKQETNHLAQIATLKKRLERVTKARDQGIRDFLDGNARDEWLKKRTDDGLEIYELGFAKAKEMFAGRFPDIPLGDFVLPAIVSPFGETVMPSEVGDAAASHLPGEAFSRRDFILPGGLLFTENANLDMGRRPRRNAVYFTDSSKLSISKVAALNRPRKHAKDSHVLLDLRCRRRDHIEAYENWEAVLLSGWPLTTDIQIHPLGEIVLENDI
ncbi:hypothetical protein RJ639_030626 [Escallonia herrerae]|uniref:Transposase (putative) gypsy type domain-containing protein n=1 Tax=Escallonia herrerae TaxID=1293975 RepID=A0AA89BIE5_9ASTE|nr:hypothetical protein RJ639_030626 [Escallonia herrerae]